MAARMVVLLSGGGTTLENIFEYIERGDLDVQVELVVSSKEGVLGLERASKRGVDTAVVASGDYRSKNESGKMVTDWEKMSRALDAVILPRKPDLICLAGFMCKYLYPPELDGKIMNIHPALIPSFCGKGMYGHHVHEGVVATGVKVSGCTVHFVNNEYDAGPIILQRTCPVYDTDTPDDVAARVFTEECKAYPEAIRLFVEGRLKIEGRVVRVLGE